MWDNEMKSIPRALHFIWHAVNLYIHLLSANSFIFAVIKCIGDRGDYWYWNMSDICWCILLTLFLLTWILYSVLYILEVVFILLFISFEILAVDKYEKMCCVNVGRKICILWYFHAWQLMIIKFKDIFSRITSIDSRK